MFTVRLYVMDVLYMSTCKVLSCEEDRLVNAHKKKKVYGNSLTTHYLLYSSSSSDKHKTISKYIHTTP